METFICVICEKETIAPRAHITTHTIDEISECFTRLTIQNKKKDLKKISSKEDLTKWNLKP